ncbi:MAG: aromatic amino acid ammonia-lyase [Synergistaceae bacterium]|nr:aromatic amino acid ammonia-lyase [Synergistaceae bacterium]
MAVEECPAHEITLDGKNMTVDAVAKIARYGAKVRIAPEAWGKAEKSHAVLRNQIAGACGNLAKGDETSGKIYGLTTGVGGNKTQSINRSRSGEFNKNMLRAHCLSVGDELPQEAIRAAMAVRLSNLLIGTSGMQPVLVRRFADFLNLGIHPIVRAQGSVGDADIAMMSHIGLAMLGEGEVIVRGERVSARKALSEAGLAPIEPDLKDGLSLVSTNGISTGMAALLTRDLRRFADIADLVYALSMEGLCSNTFGIDKRGVRERRFAGTLRSIDLVSNYLKGSYLFTRVPDDDPTFRDTISYGNATHIHGALRDALEFAERQLGIQLISSEDHPGILIDENTVIPTGNYESLMWVQCYEFLAITMSHVSRMSAYRTTRLNTRAFTGLPDFLLSNRAREMNMHGLAVAEKVASSVDAETRHLANPASCDYYPLASDREDHGCNAPYVILKLKRILENAYMILAIESLHAAQAVDLRLDASLGAATGVLHSELRKKAEFIELDRELSGDLASIAGLLRSDELFELIQKSIGGVSR